MGEGRRACGTRRSHSFLGRRGVPVLPGGSRGRWVAGRGPRLPLVRAPAAELVESDKLREAESEGARARSRRSRHRGHGGSPGPQPWAQGLLFGVGAGKARPPLARRGQGGTARLAEARLQPESWGATAPTGS